MDDASAAYFCFTAEDEALHEVGPEPQWNESMLFHLVEDDGASALMVRIGRRVNEGHAEVSVVHPLAKGAAIGFQRVPISDNLAMTAGGLTFTMIEPMKRWKIRYDGAVRLVDDGLALVDPRILKSAPQAPCVIELEFEDRVPLFGAVPGGGYAGNALCARHYEGAGKVTGTITLDGKTRKISGSGFRDHSWGERNWQSIDYWRWLWGHTDNDNLFNLIVLQAGGGPVQVNGIVLKDGELSLITEMTVKGVYHADADAHLDTIELNCVLKDGSPMTATLSPRSSVALRHLKNGELIRIVESLAEGTWDGEPIVGWTEIADRIEDGVPFGNAVA